MSILIKGMEVPESGTYEVSIDSANGKDKTVMSLFVRGEGGLICCGVYELIPVPRHGDLIDRDALRASIRESIEECHKWADEVDKDTMMYARTSQSLGTFVECSLRAKAAPTIIPAEEGET